MADLTKLRWEILQVIKEHTMYDAEVCLCEPGYAQGPGHIADAIMHVIEENIIIHG